MESNSSNRADAASPNERGLILLSVAGHVVVGRATVLKCVFGSLHTCTHVARKKYVRTGSFKGAERLKSQRDLSLPIRPRWSSLAHSLWRNAATPPSCFSNLFARLKEWTLLARSQRNGRSCACGIVPSCAAQVLQLVPAPSVPLSTSSMEKSINRHRCTKVYRSHPLLETA